MMQYCLTFLFICPSQCIQCVGEMPERDDTSLLQSLEHLNSRMVSRMINEYYCSAVIFHCLPLRRFVLQCFMFFKNSDVLIRKWKKATYSK